MANAHFVPQFFLRNFEIPDKPGWVCSYKRGVKAKPMAIKSVASIDNYYGIKSDLKGFDKSKIEKLLADIESGAAPVINHLLTANDCGLEQNDKDVLAMFIAYLAFRTPRARKQLMAMDQKIRLELEKIFMRSKEAVGKAAEALGVAPELAEKARQAALESEDSLEIEYEYEGGETDDYFLFNAIEIANKMSDILAQKQLHLLECTGGFFVTSDHPVLLTKPDNSSYIPVGYPEGQILLPISPKRCLFLGNERISEKVIHITEKQAAQLNDALVSQSVESIFSHAYSSEIEKTFQGEQEGGNPFAALPAPG